MLFCLLSVLLSVVLSTFCVCLFTVKFVCLLYLLFPVNATVVLLLPDPVFLHQHESLDHTAPSWATDEVRATLQTISDFTMSFMFNTLAKQRLSAGQSTGGVASHNQVGC